jgi:Mrp family chromosome partitioning ATPase
LKTENLLSGRIALHGEIAEIKRIYSAIETSLKHRESSCLVITSSIAGEGKTTMVAGLAAYAAKQPGERVLAMDLNWYSPALHTFFGAELNVDPNRLKIFDSIMDVVKPSGLKNLDIFPAVRSNSDQELAFGESETIAIHLMQKARKEYSLVIVDTSAIYPPNRRMIDPAIISKEADGVAVVALANATPREDIKRAMKILDTAGANILGMIANQWKNPMM